MCGGQGGHSSSVQVVTGLGVVITGGQVCGGQGGHSSFDPVIDISHCVTCIHCYWVRSNTDHNRAKRSSFLLWCKIVGIIGRFASDHIGFGPGHALRHCLTAMPLYA